MKQDLIDIISDIQGQKILVLGDMVADIYLHGTISRISREAPVLVLEQSSETIVAGGAANVVNNAATLGGQVFAAGLLGLDSAARGLKTVLERNGADTAGLFCDEKRPTIAKTRIIAGGRATVSQQIVRIDKESHEPLAPAFESHLWHYIKGLLPKIHGVVLSDYGCGTITDKLRDKLLAECQKREIPTIVDSRYDISRFAGVDYIKQNDAELAAAVGRSLPDEDALYDAAQEILQKLGARGVLITRGEQGMVLFEESGAIHNIPVSDRSEVYDVSGAGDTCVAVVILALAAGVEPVRAAELSNVAAGIAVRKLGTATVGADELTEALGQRS